MEDCILIISMLAVMGLGFIPVLQLNRFINRNRRFVIDVSREKKITRRKHVSCDPIDEFEKTGVICFDKFEEER